MYNMDFKDLWRQMAMFYMDVGDLFTSCTIHVMKMLSTQMPNLPSKLLQKNPQYSVTCTGNFKQMQLSK